MMELEFISYKPELATIFMELNLAWIEKYFVAESLDLKVLNDPQTYIIERGGYIYFAVANGKVVGTFALLKKTNADYELGKMAVAETAQGNKIGNRMMEFCIAEARTLKIQKIMLYSNTILQPAIHLYRKYGFKEVPAGEVEYKRSNIKMELDLN